MESDSNASNPPSSSSGKIKQNEFPWAFIAKLIFCYGIAKLFCRPFSDALSRTTKFQCPLPGGKELKIELADPVLDIKAVNEPPTAKLKGKTTKPKLSRSKKKG